MSAEYILIHKHLHYYEVEVISGRLSTLMFTWACLNIALQLHLNHQITKSEQNDEIEILKHSCVSLKRYKFFFSSNRAHYDNDQGQS